MKKITNKRGLNKSIEKVFTEHLHDDPNVIDEALKEVAKKYGMTFKALNDWMVDRI